MTRKKPRHEEVPITVRLRSEIASFLRSQSQKIKMSDAPRAQRFLERNSPLVNRWLHSEIERFMKLEERTEQRAVTREDPNLRFLGEDFTEYFPRGVQAQLPIKGGARLRLPKMPISRLPEAAAAIRAGGKPTPLTAARREAKAAYLESLYEKARPYAQGHRGFTIGDYFEAREREEGGSSASANG